MLATHFAQQLRRSRVALYTFLPFAALAAAGGGAMDYLQPVLRVVYIIAGFSLIIFLHELGHFMVARFCSVKCLAFSIGIGPRMCGWRKHGKFSFGPDPYDPDARTHKHVATDTAAVQSDLPTVASEPPHPPRVGDCDYRLSWLPLGGYVRMLGQDDMDPTKISTDPHAFNRRPIWQRMCIVSAGVIMNVIFAAVCFSVIFSPGIGVDFPPARVGAVTYGMPAWDKIHLGDQIVSINGEKPRGFLEFTDVMMAAALAQSGETITLDVIPYGADPHSKPVPVSLVPQRSDATGFLAFGIEQIPGLKIGGTGKDYTSADAEKAARQQVTFDANKDQLNKLTDEGWKITAVDDVDLRDAPEPAATHDKYVPLYNHVNQKDGAPVKLALQNVKTGATQDITLYPHIEYVPGENMFPAVMGLAPQLLTDEPSPHSPAARVMIDGSAGFKPGDRILAVGDRTAPQFEEVRQIISHTDTRPFDIHIERDGRELTAHLAGIRRKDGLTQIGLPYYQDLRTSRFNVIPGSAADAQLAPLDLDATSTIVAIGDRPVANWQDIYAVLRTTSPDAPVKVTFRTDHAWTGQRSVMLTFPQADKDIVTSRLQFMLGLHLEYETKTQKAANAGEAILMGMDHTKKFILNVYMTLAGLARGTVDPSNLHGIVGITKVGYDVQERGPVWLWYILALVSVNLAVANFLPLPIVDGGLFLLLILEKVRGRPLPLKVQTAIQTVGIVVLASLFLYVTMNDISLFKF